MSTVYNWQFTMYNLLANYTSLAKRRRTIRVIFRDSSVAERLAVNQDVAGSNPAPGAQLNYA